MKVAAGEVGKAFEIIKEGISDLIVGEEMYLYLIDELTGEPVQAEGWPLVITTPSEIVPKLLPLMMVGMRAMCIYNGIAGLAKMFGCPLPNIPEDASKGAQESIKKESSVEEFDVVHEQVKGGNEEKKSVRGASLREFVDFMKENDPGLKENKSGNFAGLQRIGDPEEGTALWTTLTDPADIENALKKRAEQRKEEQLKHDEHVKETAKKETGREEGSKAEISEEERILPLTAGALNLSIDAQAPSMHSEEITKLIKAVAAAAAQEATAPAIEAAAAANKAASAANESTTAANRAISAANATNACCVIM